MVDWQKKLFVRTTTTKYSYHSIISVTNYWTNIFSLKLAINIIFNITHFVRFERIMINDISDNFDGDRDIEYYYY